MKPVHFTSGLPRVYSTFLQNLLAQNPKAHTTEEHELGWPYGDHKIRSEVKPLKPDWHDVLGREFSEQIKQSFSWINDL
jgi:hypothetical protein